LASAKGKNLTPIEKRHLRGLLCRCSPSEIAEKLNKSLKGLEVDLSNTIYSYVKILINRGDEKVENWRNICQWLDDSGYKSKSVENPSKSNHPIQVNAKVHIENITIDENNNNIEIGILIQLPFTTK
jgi:hypothetical protein